MSNSLGHVDQLGTCTDIIIDPDCIPTIWEKFDVIKNGDLPLGPGRNFPELREPAFRYGVIAHRIESVGGGHENKIVRLVVENLPLRRLLSRFHLLYRGRHVEVEGIHRYRGRRVEMEASERQIEIEVDGEPLGGTPIRVELLPAALTVLGPAT